MSIEVLGSGDGAGAVTLLHPSASIDCRVQSGEPEGGGECRVEFVAEGGGLIELEASANPGHVFTGWDFCRGHRRFLPEDPAGTSCARCTGSGLCGLAFEAGVEPVFEATSRFDRDGDGDEVGHAFDNCPAVANADQADGDGDGVGDACEGLGDLIFLDDFSSSGSWAETVLASPSSEATAEDRVIGGNPGGYRHMTHSLDSPLLFQAARVDVFHRLEGAIHDPAVDGPIASLDYREDRIEFSGREVRAAFALQQDGTIFVVSRDILGTCARTSRRRWRGSRRCTGSTTGG